MSTEKAVIAAARRTPIGAMLGALSRVSATDLGATAIRSCLGDSGLPSGEIDEVLMGCVLPAGLGQAPARQAALGAGLDSATPCATISKVCGSGLFSVMLAHDRILADPEMVVVAGGMESMSNAPYLVEKARDGLRMGHKELRDHMFLDGLQNPYDGRMMGFFAEETARRYQFSRREQDEFAVDSVTRALASREAFGSEIIEVNYLYRGNTFTVSEDEEPGRCDLGKIPAMRPAFARDGTVTAASSSSISDGAAALVLLSESRAGELGVQPLASVAGHATHAHEPEWFTTAPGPAIGKVLERAGWAVDDVDLFEINEAFACVAMAAMRDLGLPHEKVNVRGGACALGHPIGASGARILVTLIHALRDRGGGRGVAALCIGGGEAVAVAVEVP
ncbi:MAG: acetyl-CoA C-acyltransferase [Gammaproteobacteria bacterium]|nr:acetyl-CoA C-acyltransferase [Chromatiales bacterium]MYA29916.1 acetyl-CoA C-acyltransferase [Gammaproteobacteria bacterium]MYF66990.1 acetyl-CoA C-acyltransferase [Gammaproteobacteria bacterium]MYK36422.1 acetyl-CoA C-acyltransferase [Gammaproteobacteria bacterium]